MNDDVRVADWIDWSLQQPKIIETKDYVCPIIANVPIDNQELNPVDYWQWQYQIGEFLPLEKLYVNVIGAAFIGKYKESDFAWEMYKMETGPDFLINEDAGIPFWLSNILGIECNFANELLWIHSGLFREKTYSIEIISQALRAGTIKTFY